MAKHSTGLKRSRAFRRAAIGVAGAALVGVGLSGTAIAGPSASSIWLDQVVSVSATAAQSGGVASHGDSVRFGVSTTRTNSPWVQLICTQGGATVYNWTLGYFPGALGDGSFTLASEAWSSGSADCVAKLQDYGRGNTAKTLATVSFAVAP